MSIKDILAELDRMDRMDHVVAVQRQCNIEAWEREQAVQAAVMATVEKVSGECSARVPGYMVEPAQDYVERGVEPDHHDFLYELLCNDLVGVFKFADNNNLAALQTWVTWLWWEVPGNAWGSPEKVKAWCEQGGLEGRPA